MNKQLNWRPLNHCPEYGHIWTFESHVFCQSIFSCLRLGDVDKCFSPAQRILAIKVLPPSPLCSQWITHTQKKIQTYLIFYKKAHSCYICHSLLLVQSGSQKFVFFSVSKIDPQPQGCESITKMVHFWLTYLFQEQANSETFFLLYRKKCI